MLLVFHLKLTWLLEQKISLASKQLTTSRWFSFGQGTLSIISDWSNNFFLLYSNLFEISQIKLENLYVVTDLKTCMVQGSYKISHWSIFIG